ncbi:MAG: glutathione S-transferase N-terminal domain-containing protein [Candidatus Cloacimonetes bacterium]|nr:glutathione S-transferase N-terminal domain-containing protein [Candidatus Cloacimonadota bacterium]
MKKVLIYCTQGCPWCIKVMEYLKSKNIPFQAIDVSKDKKEADIMFKRSGQLTVPQIWIDSKLIVGFDKNKINKELAL